MAEANPWSLDGLINFLNTGLYDPATGATTPEEYVTQWVARGGLSELFAPLSEADTEKFLNMPWPEAMAASITKWGTSEDATPAIRSWVGDKAGAIIGVIATYLVERVKELNQKYPGLYDSLLQGAAVMMQHVVNRVAGTAFPPDAFFNATKAQTIDEVRLSLGKFITDTMQGALPTEAAAKGFFDRTPGDAEWDNYARISGLSMRLQVGDILASWISSVLPFNMPDGFKDLAERIDKAIALEDSIEEIIQVPMQAAIQKGLEQWYNRKLLSNDLSEGQARQAVRAGLLDPADLEKILDNLGIRKDVRKAMWELDAPDMSEAEIDQLYQRNIIDLDKVREIYKGKTVIDPEREWKVKLVHGQRRWKLEEQVKELYGNLYRDGVAAKEEVTPFLEHLGYESDEVDMWFQVQELERRQRRWLTKSDVSGLVKSKVWSVQEARDYFVLQGMTVQDATWLFQEEIVTEAIKQLPQAVKDQCAEILSPEALLKDLLGQALALGDPSIVGNQYFRKLLECVLEKLGLANP